MAQNSDRSGDHSGGADGGAGIHDDDGSGITHDQDRHVHREHQQAAGFGRTGDAGHTETVGSRRSGTVRNITLNPEGYSDESITTSASDSGHVQITKVVIPESFEKAAAKFTAWFFPTLIALILVMCGCAVMIGLGISDRDARDREFDRRMQQSQREFDNRMQRAQREADAQRQEFERRLDQSQRENDYRAQQARRQEDDRVASLKEAMLKLDRQYRMTELKLDDWTVVGHRAGLALPGDYTRGPQGNLDAESFHIDPKGK